MPRHHLTSRCRLIMMAYSVLFSVLTVLHTVLSQEATNIPLQCRRPPPGFTDPAECCKIPDMFTDGDLSDCDITKSEGEPPGFIPPKDCSKQICVLKKYDLIRDETRIIKEAAAAFIDKWAETNPEYKNATAIAKDKCLTGNLPGPPHICEPDKLMFCYLHYIHSNCPNWEETDRCKKLKEHLEECKPYFYY